MKAKKSSSFKLIIILLSVFVVAAALLVAGLMIYSKDYQDKSGYYVSTEASSDGDYLTEAGIKKYFGVKKMEDIMSLYLKDTGDCGVFAINKGMSGTWKENKSGEIVVDISKSKFTLTKGLNKLVFQKKKDNKNIEIVLEKADKTPKCFKDNPELTFGVKYGITNTMDLCNYMQDGQYLIDNGELYGKYFVDGEYVLGKGEISKENGLSVDNITVLEGNGQGKFLTRYGENIYYLWAPADGSTESIRKISIDENKSEVVREGDVDYVQVRYGNIYFADENYRLFKMNLNGKKEEIVLDKEVYMPYVIDKDWIIFQDDADGETLHMAKINTGYDKRITNERTYAWTICGNDLYYTSTSDTKDEYKHRCKLHRLNLRDAKSLDSNEIKVDSANGYMGDSFEINSKFIYGGDGKYVQRELWNTLSNKLYEKMDDRLYLLYLSNKYYICGHMKDDNTFDEIKIININNDKQFSIIENINN